MIIYLTIYFITLCLCIITYVWVKHKKRKQREVALADELIEDENGIIVTRRNYPTSGAYHLQQLDGLYPSIQLTHNIFPDEVRPKTDKLSPKKRMKVHKIDQEIRKETFVSPRLSYGKWRDRHQYMNNQFVDDE